ncbi:hypothetical protein ADIARSV_2918 [Arcticibacter svalbardensis MN12-7]|uniref:Uncharacterized protein n=1 Tax=Arcticibacter svalbardensis MN12-7 TaxID=1150600 RepID=R9GQU5_9SPHI|nr:hypothetical protein [Arcticibacter svalbardensis]EOR93925.1 hypothetical protein ADIARSV_2918 [Arcticibacter svalbardensis MN12-7]
MSHIKKVALFGLSMAMLTLASANTVKDSLQFGNQQSENLHGVKAELSEIINGKFNLSARKLLPPKEEGWRGGRISFNVNVDPDNPNYITARFWGGDINEEQSRLMLFIDGKQVGQRHLGEIDQLDIMYNYPRNPTNFFYKTFPLPENMTKGKKNIELAIEAQGPIWGYGGTFEKYQKPMTQASRGIYAVYIHTEPYLELLYNSKNTEAWDDLQTPTEPGEEVLDYVKEKVNKAIEKDLNGKDKIEVGGIHFLAKAYLVKWSAAYNKAQVIDKIAKAISIHYAEFKSNPDIVGKTWEGYGAIGDAISLLAKPLEPYLDKSIEGTGKSTKEAWSEMLLASRNWHIQNRRSYTNQSMIVDWYIYQCNRGIAVLTPEKAWPEKKNTSHIV